MTDYFMELNLDKSMSAADITGELDRIERIWKQRRVTNPERAEDMLVLIGEAREQLTTDDALEAYLAALDAERKPVTVDADADRREAFESWKAQAESYYNNDQYDLAKTAVENAMQNYSNEWEDVNFLLLASLIYKDNKQTDTAMDYINKAIVLSPERGDLYFIKACIYEDKSLARYVDNKDACAFVYEAKKLLYTYIEMCENRGMTEASRTGYGVLSFLCYFRDDGQGNRDRDRAEEFAQIAVDRGDKSTNCQRVLDDIKKKREEDEARRKEAEERARQQEEERRRREAEQAAYRRRQEEWDKTRKTWMSIDKAGLALLIVFLILSIIVVVATRGPVGNMLMAQNWQLYYRFAMLSGVVWFMSFISILVAGLGNGFKNYFSIVLPIILAFLATFARFPINNLTFFIVLVLGIAIYIVGYFVGKAKRNAAEKKRNG